MKPVIFNSFDDGAPVLKNTPGSMNNVIKTCLISGYGTKNVNGWSIIYEDIPTNILVLSSTSVYSQQCVLAIDDTAQNSAKVTGYNGWDVVSNIGNAEFASGHFVKQWSNPNPSWFIIASDIFFYIFVQSELTSPSMKAMNGFGDVKSVRNGSVYSILMASTDTVYNQQNTGRQSVNTNTKEIATFPVSMFPKNSTSTGFGDRSDTHRSGIISLTPFVLYIKTETYYEPALMLPGMLAPSAQVTYYQDNYSIYEIPNQYPYIESIIGTYQPWHGNVWFQMDDWSVT